VQHATWQDAAGAVCHLAPLTLPASPALTCQPCRCRYAALVGATLEMNRLTGLALDPGTRQMYTTVYSVAKGMLEDPVDLSLPRDSVRLQRSPCGCLYTINVDVNNNANFMSALHCGKPDVDSTKVRRAGGDRGRGPCCCRCCVGRVVAAAGSGAGIMRVAPQARAAAAGGALLSYDCQACVWNRHVHAPLLASGALHSWLLTSSQV
jgi:hypothetical protein